jgi:hypothetical protein
MRQLPAARNARRRAAGLSHWLGCRYHPEWQPSQAHIGAAGDADRRSAKIASAGMNQSREAHHPARPLHSPEGAMTPRRPGRTSYSR